MGAKRIDKALNRPVRPRGVDEIDVNDWLVGALMVGAAVAASWADCRPTTWGPADVVLTCGFAGIVTLAASNARRWSWLVAAGAAGFMARGNELLVCAGVAVAVAVYAATLVDRRHRVSGAIVGAASVQVLLRMPELRLTGLTALIAAAAVAPLVVSGHRLCSPHTRRRTRLVVATVGGIGFLGAIGLATAALEARSETQSAVSDMRLGLDSARSGHQVEAGAHLEAARAAFASANETFSTWYARPARTLPILSQHLRAARIMAASGEDLAGAAETAATTARYEDLRTSEGQVNLGLLTEMVAPVSLSVDSLGRADVQLNDAPSEWLMPVLADPLDELRKQVRDALPEARGAADALRSVPPLLGANGPRRYFIAFGTPSESRELGGFIGSFGELTVVNGKIQLTRSGPIQELSEHAGAEKRTLRGLDDYLSRYGRFQPARYLQNTSASPDFPTVAEALRQLYPQAGGSAIDGVVYIDPYGIAALLKVTGPVTVQGLDQQLSADNAVDFLLRDQYVRFPDKLGADGRNEILVRATKATFEALTSRALPGPRALMDALGPAAADRRLQFVAFDANDRAFLERLNVTGAFPEKGQNGFLSFRTSNGGANKIDSFLERSIDYSVRYDPSTGVVDATATIKLANNAPSSGLPDYIIANTPGVVGAHAEAPGTNILDFSMYADGELQDASRDGVAMAVQSQYEFGHHVWSNRVAIAPGGQTTLVFHTKERVEGGRYKLDVARPPAVGADRLAVSVGVTPGWSVSRASGWPGGNAVKQSGDGGWRVGGDPIDQHEDARFELDVAS